MKQSTATTELPEIKATIVGPMAPAEQLDRMDAEEKKEYESWQNMREAVLTFGRRQGLVKRDTSAVMTAPSALRDGDDVRSFGHSDMHDQTLPPPYDMSALCALYENSSALRQNIDAMVTNIDGFGHQFKPVLDFSDPEIDKKIRDIMLRVSLEKKKALPSDLMSISPDEFTASTPSDEDVQKTKTHWSQIAAVEKGQIACFFDFINPVDSFTEVRKATRESRELMGNAGWEVIKENPEDFDSEISQVYQVPFTNVRLLPSDLKPTKVEMKIRSDEVHFDTVKVERFFRRFVKITGKQRVYYKEFGDPRIVSRKTGKFYETVEIMRDDEHEGKDAQVANEFFHWKVRSPISPYGIPRWIGALLSVLGSRASEEVNFIYFDNKTIPPMVLLVSGGRVSTDSVAKIESYLKDKVRGRENYHKIMVIEGVPSSDQETSGNLEHSGKLRVEFKPLLDAQLQDGLFQQYDANNITKIGRSFRQPQLLTGDTKDQNRSTADVAKAFAEEQIYQPGRDEFDAIMDRHFLTNLNVHFWRFKTNAPVQRIPNDLVDNVRKSLDMGAITANEARPLLADAFSVELPHRPEDWASTPPKIVLQEVRHNAMAANLDSGQPDGTGAEEVAAKKAAAVIARGKTSTTENHSHEYVAIRNGENAEVFVLPGGDDGHIHPPLSVAAKPGVSVTSDLPESHGHTHIVEFTVPLSKAQKKANSFMNFLGEIRQTARDEMESVKDDLFALEKTQPEDE